MKQKNSKIGQTNRPLRRIARKIERSSKTDFIKKSFTTKLRLAPVIISAPKELLLRLILAMHYFVFKKELLKLLILYA